MNLDKQSLLWGMVFGALVVLALRLGFLIGQMRVVEKRVKKIEESAA